LDVNSSLFKPLGERQYWDVPVSLDETSGGDTTGLTSAFLLPLPQASDTREYMRVSNELLSSQGWAVQERILAPRTLHFTTDQTFFECSEDFLGEDGVQLGEAKLGIDIRPLSPSQSLSGYKTQYQTSWGSLSWYYGDLKFSNSSDKLSALSALAKPFEQRLEDEYVSGLWKNNLLRNLPWQAVGDECVLAPIYRAPSWSWASIDGMIALDATDETDETSQALATIVDVRVRNKDNNRYGEIEEAYITVEGLLVPLYRDQSSRTDSEKDDGPNVRARTRNGDSFHVYHNLDTLDDLEFGNMLAEGSVFLLGLLEYPTPDESGVYRYKGLVVNRVGDDRDRSTYIRLGLVFISDDDLGDVRLNLSEYTEVLKLI
jgi:hypothetical protein